MESNVSPQDLFRSDDFESTDLAIVLGSGDPFLRHRIDTAVTLIKANRVPRLLLLGKELEGCTEADRMRSIALDAGVPCTQITVEKRSSDTVENAENCCHMLRTLPELQGVRTIALVTSAWHMLRGLMIMRHHLPAELTLLCHPAMAPGFNSDDWRSTKLGNLRVRKELEYIGRLLNDEYRLP